MNKFYGEDLLIMNIDEIKSHGKVVIENSRINRFRDSLRKQGVIYDLGIHEFETLQFRYPETIEIKSRSITIKGSSTFKQLFYQRKPELEERLKLVVETWMSTHEDNP